MIIKSISYQKVKNLGNYESERLEATATLEEDESAGEAVNQLRAFVEFQLDAPVSPFEDIDDDDIFEPSPGSTSGM